MVVRDLAPEATDEDDLLVLTAAHLVAGFEAGTSMLVCPEGPAPGIAEGQYCGTLRRKVPMQNLPHIAVDAAVIKPPPDFPWTNVVDGGSISGIHDVWAGEDGEDFISVRKHGAQTGLTTGQLWPVDADHFVHDVRARYTCGWWAYGDNGALFATGGDSGAIVVDDQRRAVGMAVAIEHADGASAGTFVHGIKQVLRALEVELI